MIELLRRAAGEDPEALALVTGEATWSYGGLVELAESVAAGLLARGISRFGIVSHDPATVVALLAASSLAGAEACQYAPTDDVAAVVEIAGRLDHATVVVDPGTLEGLAGRTTLEELRTAGGDAPAEPPEARPLLVMTTGSTGTPKAARHDWNRVLRAAGRIAPDPGRRWLLAYGLHQFAGLQILVHVLASRGCLVAAASLRPPDGLVAIRAHDVTAVSATPTWWRFALADLRSSGAAAPDLAQITLGGEAAPDPLLRQLAEAFPAARIAHVYAATEVGSTGSTTDGRGGLHVSVLERGDDADVAMRIVDGELWVRSRIGMLGYYGDEPAADPDGWRNTGDLVEVVGDRIVFQGRATEVINVGGVKVSPLPIEELVEAVPGVEVARVFGRPNKMTGAIVAIEAVVAPSADPESVADAIRDACADLPSAWRPRSVRIVEDIATVGGKRTRRTDSGS